MCSFVSILFKAIDLLSFLILEVSLDFEWISRKEGFNSFFFWTEIEYFFVYFSSVILFIN